MNVEIGTETPIFLFWEYLFQNFWYFVFALHLSATVSSTFRQYIFLLLLLSIITLKCGTQYIQYLWTVGSYIKTWRYIMRVLEVYIYVHGFPSRGLYMCPCSGISGLLGLLHSGHTQSGNSSYGWRVEEPKRRTQTRELVRKEFYGMIFYCFLCVGPLCYPYTFSSAQIPRRVKGRESNRGPTWLEACALTT